VELVTGFEVSVVCGTFGDKKWADLAYARAFASVPDGVRFIHRHDQTLAKARNKCIEAVDTEWVVHLDADDEILDGYLEAMATGKADMRAPSIQHCRVLGVTDEPSLPHVIGHNHVCVGECLREGNWLCIGTCVRTELIRQVGGWEEWPVFEDYALFSRIWRAGGTAEAIPEAVYLQHVTEGSRNQGDADTARRTYDSIRAAIWA
jgi:glycosyltransferase involved in cell wall biosynthesis